MPPITIELTQNLIQHSVGFPLKSSGDVQKQRLSPNKLNLLAKTIWPPFLLVFDETSIKGLAAKIIFGQA